LFPHKAGFFFISFPNPALPLFSPIPLFFIKELIVPSRLKDSIHLVKPYPNEGVALTYLWIVIVLA